MIKKLGGEIKTEECQLNYPAGPAFSSKFCGLPENQKTFDCLKQPRWENHPMEEPIEPLRVCYCQFLKGTYIRRNQYETRD